MNVARRVVVRQLLRVTGNEELATVSVNMLKKSRKPAVALIAGMSLSFFVGADVPRTACEMRAPDSPYSIRASDVIGATVVNGDNVELGEVDDIVVEQQRERIRELERQLEALRGS